MDIWTVGHSNLSLDEFLDLLRAHRIGAIADVRRFPGSRRHPHFSGIALAETLPASGIDYHGFAALGGRRAPRPDSPNTAWRVAGFRGYADYMESEEFQVAFRELLTLAERRRTAVMCAEAVWWRCHRSLIADAMKAADVSVWHILSTRKAESHPYTSAARLIDGKLSYALPEDGTLFD